MTAPVARSRAGGPARHSPPAALPAIHFQAIALLLSDRTRLVTSPASVFTPPSPCQRRVLPDSMRQLDTKGPESLAALFVCSRATARRRNRSPEASTMETNTETAVTGAGLYHKLSVLGQYDYDREACDRYASIIAEIHRLKAQRKAVVLAH